MFKPYDHVAYYSDSPSTQFFGWNKISHYTVLRPTGPRIKSYWVLYRTWFGAKTQTLRVPVTKGTLIKYRLVTEVEYKEHHARRIADYEKKEMWKILQEGNFYKRPGTILI